MPWEAIDGHGQIIIHLKTCQRCEIFHRYKDKVDAKDARWLNFIDWMIVGE